jgi:hypothetical protein
MELRMKDTISFSVPGSTSIHDLQVGAALVRFIGFDFKYFGEQCAQIYRRQLSAGEDALAKAAALKELLRNCHPYVAALLHSEFDKVALDCIIEYICTTENAGLEELWVRNLSAKDTFGQAVFERITEYKTGFAINQWTNLLRMRAYADAKAAALYGGPEAELSVHKARKLYYDTAFRLTAARLGFGLDDLPHVRVSGIPFLPESMEMMKNAVNTLEPIIEKKTEGIEAREPLRGRDCVQDQMAGMALNIMMNLKRPEIDELMQLIQSYGTHPVAVYVPSSFKAVIDLEFDQLIEKGFCLRPEQTGYSRVRYSLRKEPEKSDTHPEILSPAAADKPEAGMRPKTADARTAAVTAAAAKKIVPAETILKDLEAPPEPQEADAPEPPANLKSVVADLGNGSSGKVKTIIEMAEDPNRKASQKRTLQEVNMRCNLIWTSMNVRSGWSISSEEASEWFRYLTRLRYGIGTGELTPEALDRFLDATLEVYKLLPENT